MHAKPPVLEYAQQLPRPSITTPPGVRNPRYVAHWASFQGEVLTFINRIDNRLVPTYQYRDRVKVHCEIPGLQMACSLNIFESIININEYELTIGDTNNVVGNPNGIIKINEENVMVIEIEGKWTLDRGTW